MLWIAAHKGLILTAAIALTAGGAAGWTAAAYLNAHAKTAALIRGYARAPQAAGRVAGPGVRV